MTLDADRERELFAEYLGLLEEQSQLQASFDALESKAQETGRAQANEAGLAERRLRDSVRSVEHRLDVLQPRVGRLTSMAEVVDERSVAADPALRSVHDCERALDAIAADLRAAESSWQWIERNPPPVMPVANIPAPPRGPAVNPKNPGQGNSHQPQKGRSTAPLWAAAILVVVAIASLLVVIL